MKYRVFIEPRAKADLKAAYLFIAEDSPAHADDWFANLLRAVATLETMPRRCPLAIESDAFDVEIRQLIHGNYRVLFTVSGSEVTVTHVRHAARRPLGFGETTEDEDDPDSDSQAPM